PFIGYTYQSAEQKHDVERLCGTKKIDYVACWYFKAAEMIRDTATRAAFVSTNSITQGEQAAAVWRPLFGRGVHIDFAWRTFVWDSEAADRAHVHVVIVGFSSAPDDRPKTLYSEDSPQPARNINPYLVDAPTVFVESRQRPLCDVPEMAYGNKPTDGGFLFLTEEEREQFLKEEPETAKFIRQAYGATEYINNRKRYCLWLVGASPADLRKFNLIRDRVEKVREFRLSSPKEATKRSADTPALFQEIRQPDSEYILVPCHSSEARRYIPIGFVPPDIVVNNAVQIIPDTTLYHFGVLTSCVHMAWTRTVCGRIKSDYRYSKDIVYNNFPWPTPTDEQRAKIEQTAQEILDARAKYPDSSLADLYDELTMPTELRKAHKANDAAVLSAYGFERDMDEPGIVARLMGRYEGLAKL
ncbi:MAG: hypothetical protein IJU98_02415, partial [Synergistaceae bacterium]|nr:hypothetical protein [Synergistaceae bacterium]